MEKNKMIMLAKELLAPQFIIFNLCFLYIGVMLSPVHLSVATVVLVSAAFISARSAGVLINRYVGREGDLKNSKKVKRMVSLSVPKSTVLGLVIVTSAIFVGCAYLLNTLSLILTPVVLILLIADPMSKKYTNKRHYVLGVVESMDVFGGYIGASGLVPINPVLYILAIGVIFTGGGFDAIISIINRRYDVKNGLKTFASTVGVARALDYSMYSHVIASILFLSFAVMLKSPLIFAGALGASAVLMSEHSGVEVNDDAAIFDRVVKYNTAAAIALFSSVLIAFVI